MPSPYLFNMNKNAAMREYNIIQRKIQLLDDEYTRWCITALDQFEKQGEVTKLELERKTYEERRLTLMSRMNKLLEVIA